jgi:hypothetical protein
MEPEMQIAIQFKSGGEFVWRNVKSRELPSVFADITDLVEKDDQVRKAFGRQAKLNRTKKAVQKVNKGAKK